MTKEEIIEKGAIYFKVEGRWSVDDLIEWFSTLNIAYQRLNAFLRISGEFDRKITHIGRFEDVRHGNSWMSSIDNEYFNTLTLNPLQCEPLFNSIIQAALRKTYQLELMRIEICSPGFVELIGNINPLKVIADFITNWRKENTIRDSNNMKWETERLKIKADFMKSLIERSDYLSRKGSFQIMEMFNNFVLDKSFDKLKGIAQDSRVKSVKTSNLNETNVR
jgi:hypothetical protein